MFINSVLLPGERRFIKIGNQKGKSCNSSITVYALVCIDWKLEPLGEIQEDSKDVSLSWIWLFAFIAWLFSLNDHVCCKGNIQLQGNFEQQKNYFEYFPPSSTERKLTNERWAQKVNVYCDVQGKAMTELSSWMWRHLLHRKSSNFRSFGGTYCSVYLPHFSEAQLVSVRPHCIIH